VGGDAASVRQLASLLEEYAAAWQAPCAFGRLAEDAAADFFLFGEDEAEDNDNGIGIDNGNDNNHHQHQHRTRVWLDGGFPHAHYASFR
jgi:hypothetical protein